MLAAIAGPRAQRTSARRIGRHRLGRAAVPPRSRRRRASAPAPDPRETGRRDRSIVRVRSRPRRALAARQTRRRADDARATLMALTTAAGAARAAPARKTPPGVDAAAGPLSIARQGERQSSMQASATRAGRRVAPRREPIEDAADAVLAEALLSIAYAADVGDPEGTVLLAGDVSLRHDFGFAARDGEQRLRTAWALPRQDVMPGMPWRVNGSLLGLDVALAPLALRRVNADHVLDAPAHAVERARHVRRQPVADEPVRAARRRSRRDCRRRGTRPAAGRRR